MRDETSKQLINTFFFHCCIVFLNWSFDTCILLIKNLSYWWPFIWETALRNQLKFSKLISHIFSLRDSFKIAVMIILWFVLQSTKYIFLKFEIILHLINHTRYTFEVLTRFSVYYVSRLTQVYEILLKNCMYMKFYYLLMNF